MSKIGKVTGFTPVLAAILGNAIVTIIKFIAFFVSGSSVLFSEAIHGVADTTNQSLLMLGLKRSIKKADEDYVYGYGRERFFWAVISACGIFFLGAGVTIYHGINSMMHLEPMTKHSIVYIVLIVAFIVESITLYLAWRELKKNFPAHSFREIISEGDPSTLAVFYEDSVAVTGVVIAIISIALSYLTKNYYWDAVGSIIIGVMLGITAVVLIIKNRQYLIGHSIPEELHDEIIELLQADPVIEKVIDFKSTVLDVGVYRIKCEIEFNGNALFRELYRGKTLEDEFELVKDDYEEFKKFCVDFADRVPRLVGKKIDEIENKLKKEYKSVKYIDIELN